jgi:glycosyltransferase involved in cell wall biosynthesis
MIAPRCTVLIDTYNYGRYVEGAIESALQQDFPEGQREILVVDDGSTDDTPERVKKYGEAIRYLRKPNGGQASAFNCGFAEARGEIVATLDADDLWMPEKLRRVCEAFDKNADAGLVYHRTHWWDGESKLENDPYFVEVSGRVPSSRKALLLYPMIGTSCLAFRREIVKRLLPIPEELRSQADAYLTALVIFLAPVVGIGEYLGKYRLHGANLFQTSGTRPPVERIEHRMAMRAILAQEVRTWLERNGYDPESPDLSAYLKQWKKAQEGDEFLIQSPSRWTYFRHLLEFPRLYAEIMTPRHRLYDYVRALGALVLGYRHLHLIDDARRAYKGMAKKTTTKTT